MHSMKTLAYMETRKLGHFLEAQHTVVESIERVAADFLSFYPETLPESRENISVYLLIGTERGFCGDFNRTLLDYMESVLQASSSPDNPMLIAVGRKLHTLLEEDARVVASIEGASVVEEVVSVLTELVNEIISIQAKHDAVDIFCLYYDREGNIKMQSLLPPFQGLVHGPSQFPHPPILNLSPTAFFIEITDQYLFAALHAMLYTSLMEENQHRVTHLESAVKHLDDRSAELGQQCNAMRQEEIIEEIEVILLSAASLDDKPDRQDDNNGNE